MPKPTLRERRRALGFPDRSEAERADNLAAIIDDLPIVHRDLKPDNIATRRQSIDDN